MPKVPTYGGPQLLEKAAGPTYSPQIDVSGNARALGAGLNQAADAMSRMAERDAQTEAWNAQGEITESFTKWNAEARKNAQGTNAKGYAAQVDEWWAKAAQDYGAKLNPLARKMANRALQTARLNALGAATDYENNQLEIGERSALNGAVNGLVNQAIAAGPDKAAPVLAQAAEQIRAYGARKGVDVEPEVMKVTTGAHASIINTLLQTDPKKAELYFNTHKKEIDATRWDEIGGRINQVSAVADGESKASEIWQANIKGNDYRQPVDVFALEKQMREAFPNDPTRQKAGIAALRDMTAAWNKSQAEANAGFTNQVYGMLDRGTPLTRVMRSEAWQSLPEKEQRQIRMQLENEGLLREQRAAAREARQERQLLLQNGDAYLEYSNPETLANMTRQQVQALRSVFGMEGTQHLLTRWDALQKPQGKIEARMDTEDFNHVADQLGLSPYKANTEDKKRQLGELKFRVEQLIDQTQQAKKGPLTREEKMALMQIEMARTVVVNPFFGSKRDVPVIQLTKDDLKNVEVPAGDREQIAAALKAMYDQTQSPMYAPTEENMRRLYLMNKSRAAALLPAEK